MKTVTAVALLIALACCVSSLGTANQAASAAEPTGTLATDDVSLELKLTWPDSDRGARPNHHTYFWIHCVDCDSVSLEPGGEMIRDGNPYTRWVAYPPQGDWYFAKGWKGDQTATDSVFVEVLPLEPGLLLAAPDLVFPDREFELRAQVYYSETAWADPYVGLLGNYERGRFQVTVQDTTTFRLFVVNAFGSKADSIVVAPATPVISLSAQRAQYSGESVRLEVRAEGADVVTLEPGFGEIPGTGFYTIAIQDTTTYWLRASNRAGESEVSRLVVALPPHISSFRSTPSRIFSGESVDFSWNTEGAGHVAIHVDSEPIAEDLPTVGQLEGWVLHESATVALHATNAVGTSTNEFLVIVDQARITEFYADRTNVTPGRVVRLQWKVDLALEATIELEGFGEQPPIGAVDVEVNEDTTFRLVVREAQAPYAQIVSRQVTVNVVDDSVGDQQIGIVGWSLTPDGVFLAELDVLVGEEFDAYVVMRDPPVGLKAFELKAGIPPELSVVSTEVLFEGATVVSSHPEWLVGTESCVILQPFVPLVHYRLAATAPIPSQNLVFDISAITDHSLPESSPAYADCLLRIWPLVVDAPLEVNVHASVSVATIRLSAEGRGGQVTLRWDSSLGACPDQVTVFRREDASDAVVAAILDNSSACDAWTEPLPRDRWEHTQYRVVAKTPAGPVTSDFVAVSVSADEPAPVTRTRLLTNVPNPFNPSTEIRFALADPGDVRIEIFDVGGRLVRAFPLPGQATGVSSVTWHGRDEAGHEVASGVYLVRMVAGRASDTQRVVLVR